MPEYLAPGVYVEEIPSANKPIAAASTSTSAMVGMTERGPVGRPTLVTSAGDYARKFGGNLNPLAFGGGLDMLPYAAQGFFGNGGSRCYVVRVTGAGANESELQLTAATGTAPDMVVQRRAAADQADILLSNADGLAAADTLLISNGDNSEFVTVLAAPDAPRLTVATGLTNLQAATEPVTVQTLTEVTTITGFDADDASVVTVADGTTLSVADVVVIGTGPTAELAVVSAIATNDVTFDAPLANTHAAGAGASTMADSATTNALTVAAGPSGLPVHLQLDDATGFDAGEVIRIGADGGASSEFAFIEGVSQLVTLTADLNNNQPAGVTVMAAAQVATAHAISQGVWGRQLRVRSAENSLVLTSSVGTAGEATNEITVTSAFGLYPGSVIMIGEAPAAPIRAEVERADTDSGVVTLVNDLPAEVGPDTVVASQEFALIIERLSADGKVAESELFENLSLASEHPRYAPTIIGSWDTGADTPSATGQSNLIRVSDQANATTRILPLTHGVRRHLQGGTDDVGGVTDASFIGQASNDPDLRTGIEALRNVSSISLVSVPGRTNVNVHKALLNHCESMRYRFAVLETPLGSSFDASQTYRQNFDNTRCALYYPGLTIADPFGPDGATRNVTPSGHMMGLYARVDNTRGVHKAPANEVVRGILSFETKLSKGEQDILNPKNLNCFRDFRDEFRGLRAYGGRVATSDPEWRYINVRRLLLMIEQSLDTGLQWAVFEPNEKPLWDGVKQSVTGFLNTVWRSGALEGQTQEEAFFVNIGYGVTMTQDDIDNGRMVVEIGVAPVKPAEFVIARIFQKTREATG
jgi:phage tail sheath protein FI